MSYHRGDYYIWSDGKRLHLWARDGYDHWDELWGLSDEDRPRASGISIPENIADAFAVMRFAELLQNGILDSILDHVMSSPSGKNSGGDALRLYGEEIKTLLTPVLDRCKGNNII